MPKGIEDALHYYDFEQSLQNHSGNRAGNRGQEAIFHGQGLDKGYDQPYLEEYFRHVNDSLRDLLEQNKRPIVLAAVEELHPVYKHANHTFHVLDQGIKGNPDEVQPRELHQKAAEIIRPHLDKAKFDHMERYRAAAGTGKASHDIREIAPGALDGRVEALFVVHGTHRWGTIQREDNTVQLHDEPHGNDQCLVSKAAVQTVLHGGDVYFVDQESLPESLEGAALAATFRW